MFPPMGSFDGSTGADTMTGQRRESEDCGPSYEGLFESHVTVEARDADALDRFRATCAELGVKCVLIELPRGATRSQPMTNQVHRGTLPQARREAMDLAALLGRRGFPVLRVKLEAAPENRDVPEADDQATRLPRDNYFEYHVRLTLPGDEAAERVSAACGPHGAHLSSNAFRRLPGGQVERFVTLRCYGVGRSTADARMAALRGSLEAT